MFFLCVCVYFCKFHEDPFILINIKSTWCFCVGNIFDIETSVSQRDVVWLLLNPYHRIEK